MSNLGKYNWIDLFLFAPAFCLGALQDPQPVSNAPAPEQRSQPSVESKGQDNACYRVEPCRYNWQGRVEVLYWGVYQEYSGFATSTKNAIPVQQQGLSHQTQGPLHSAKFAWKPGVRVGADYTFARDRWRLNGNYTFFYSSGLTSLVPQGTNYFIQATYTATTLTQEMKIVSKSSLKYNGGELLLEKTFPASKQILFDFGMGVVGAWLTEKWKIKVLGQQENDIINNWQYSSAGIGIKEGSRWHLGKNFEIFQKIGAALLLGEYQYNYKSYFSGPLSTFARDNYVTPIGILTFEEVTAIPMFQLGMGFRWTACLNGCELALGVGLESNTWFDLHKAYKAAGSSGEITNFDGSLPINYGDSNVTLYGINFEVGVKF